MKILRAHLTVRHKICQRAAHESAQDHLHTTICCWFSNQRIAKGPNAEYFKGLRALASVSTSQPSKTSLLCCNCPRRDLIMSSSTKYMTTILSSTLPYRIQTMSTGGAGGFLGMPFLIPVPLPLKRPSLARRRTSGSIRVVRPARRNVDIHTARAGALKLLGQIVCQAFSAGELLKVRPKRGL